MKSTTRIIVSLVMASTCCAVPVLDNNDDFSNWGGFMGPSSDIVNHPWQLFLVTQLREGVSVCGAALLSQEWAITTAHCMKGYITLGMLNNSPLHFYYYEVVSAMVMGGDNNWVDMMTGKSGVQINVEHYNVHPGYNETVGSHDLALLKLTATTGSDILTPVTLPFNAILSKLEGKIVVVTGWGASTGLSDLLSPSLQSTELRVEKHDECTAMYGAMVDWPDLMCCKSFHNSAAGICKGDSGIAVTHKKGRTTYLVGVAKFRDPSCQAGAPTGFVRIDMNLAWITDVTNIK